jgi:hypothetical protein
MSLQADINWIQTEVGKIQDPLLVEAFKNLLNYRKQKDSSHTKDLLIERALDSEKDIEKGHLLSREDLENRLKRQA